MSLAVFVSHSVGSHELPVVHHLSAALTGVGVQPYLALYDRQPGTYLSKKVMDSIARSDVLLVLVTTKGTESKWVHEEIGFALGKGLDVKPLVEKGVDVGQMLSGVEHSEFDPSAPASGVESMALYLKALERAREAEAQRERVTRAEEAASQAEAIAVVAVLFAAVVILLLVATRE